ncbi:MAG: DEAD/DEAH box helicase [Clostridium sp.]|nr:DEAD/DEAH box helicase [Clostridium sp.]
MNLFTPQTAKWFKETLGDPTPVQEAAWPAIAAGGHVLVSAPTGAGKTLSAFLVFLDKLKREAEAGSLKRELFLIYVSPLKSLAADIRENLRKPLAGIGGEELISAAVRTGDTPQRERQQMVRKPPHILIITPESLYLMLTARTGQAVLRTTRAVIIDELHALIDTKRGAHLMLSLARLDALCGKPLQRIGLSATISSLTLAAQYLAPEAVSVVAPPMEKKVQLQILGSYVDGGKRKKDPVWEELSKLVYQYCQGNRSVIAFVEGRRYAEKLAYYVNLLGGEDFARVHHGSLSKEQRMETEQSLREGKLRLLCATSSMELGIDVGEIDQVLQVGCPRTVSGTRQRLGRAGHNPFRTSVMYLFPRTAAESILCGMTAQLAREGYVEPANPPEGCLDILAQHLVSMAAFKSYQVDEVMEILPRAWPFRNLTRKDVKSVLGMLAGDYEHKREVPARPRILYDRIHEKVEGDGYSRMLAVSAGGTIPDKGLYTVRTEAGVKIGEADEEFIYETQKGDRFILGAFAWRVTEIGRDTVTVVQAPAEGARLPFWKGELKGRDKETGTAFGAILRGLGRAHEKGMLQEKLEELGLDISAAALAAGYLQRQIAATGMLPDDRTILAEHFRDSSGNSQIMFHSVFGRRINAPLSLLAANVAKKDLGGNVGSVDEEDGFLLYAYGDGDLQDGLLERLNPEYAEAVLGALLPSTPLFNMAFRYNCGRALMMGVRGKSRNPLWLQRLRSAEMLEQVMEDKEHPLMRETRRECMEQLWDLEGLRELLGKIQSGEVRVREIYSETPSPMSLPLQWAQEAAVMYDYAPTPRGIHAAVEGALKREEALLNSGEELLRPREKELASIGAREKLPGDEKQLHSLLMTEGDLAAGELDIPVEWLEKLAEEGRALYLEQGLWIAAEQEEEYREALEEWDEDFLRNSPKSVSESSGGNGLRTFTKNVENYSENSAGSISEAFLETSCEAALRIVRRMLHYRGASTARGVALRYGWAEEAAAEVLKELCDRKEVVSEERKQRKETIAEEKELSKEAASEKRALQETYYYHKALYHRARNLTVRNRREEITTCPASSYASLLLSRFSHLTLPEEDLRGALSSFAGTALPAAMWEEILLPARVKNYRESLLDKLLAGGEYFWRMEENGKLRFEFTERIDWEAEPEIPWEQLSEKEKLLADALFKRGASFMQSLSGVLAGESPYEAMLSLIEKGVVCADSFMPVRQWLGKKKMEKAAVKRRIGARVKAMSAGRYDLTRPLRPLTVQEQMDKCFDRYRILCRETAGECGLPWQEAISLLRVQEYTGQVRRGYFVEGLSGAQFIRKKDFEGITSALLHPKKEIVWVNAADPMQPFGKILPHEEGKAFVNVPGTAAAFCGGRLAALFERQGKSLQVFDKETLKDALSLFVEEYRRGRIFAGKKRIAVENYPKEAEEILAESGFVREVQKMTVYK